MPLREECSTEALQYNLAAEFAAGRTQNQSMAVAHEVMRRACRAAGKPTPKKACTQEYLEAALESAKELLPSWAYAMIHNAALPKSGGRVRARMRKLQAQARLADNPALIRTATVDQRNELKSTMKGFGTGIPDFGVHVHGIDRHAMVTQMDGAHIHCFELPGTGATIYTAEDGEHGHKISGDMTGGSHSHVVFLDGSELLTSIDGAHGHIQLLETTGFDGTHTHALKLPDGTVIESMSIASARVLGAPPIPRPMPPASFFAQAILRTEMQNMEIEALRHHIYDLSEEPQQGYMMGLEVIGKHLGGLDVAFADNEHGFAVNCPEDLVCEEGDVVDVLGDAIVGKSLRLYPMTTSEAQEQLESVETSKKMSRVVEWSGPTENARLIFLTAAPNALEAARGSSVVGADAESFITHYLEPLKLKREDVLVGSIAPHWMPDPVDTTRIAPWLEQTKKRLAAHPKAVVVALGKTAKNVLGDIATTWVPHPAVVRKSGDAAQVRRKLKRISLDAMQVPGDTALKSPELKADRLADADCELGIRLVTVKSSRDEAQIVYGVVLDPNMIDSQNDWAPPREIQETAHGYLEKSRVVGLEHERRAQAKVVESFVEQYPTKNDYQAALEGRPHKITRRKFGNDYLNSGAWVLGVKLEDPEWRDYKAGNLTGFSMGGFSVKTPSDRALMPKVEVVDLVPSA